MERLTQKSFDICADYCACSKDCGFFKHEVNVMCNDAEIYNKLRAYEDAEEQGLLIRLPCKVNEVVWMFHPKYKAVHRCMYPSASNMLADIESGCLIFKTREEAEAALAKEGGAI